MDSAGYVTLGRQSGLMREMQTVANNIANVSTVGFRREGVIFAEYISRLDQEPSLSMAFGNGRMIDLTQAGISQTGGAFDFAIQGEGFFLVETPDGNRLTRAGNFIPSAEGELMTADGHRLLDIGEAPVIVPPGSGAAAVSPDGTLSVSDTPIAQIGIWQPNDPLALRHQSGTLFNGGEVEPSDTAVIVQGFLEESNVNPIREIARMIEVQRAFELGQKLLDAEDSRVRGVIQTLGS